MRRWDCGVVPVTCGRPCGRTLVTKPIETYSAETFDFGQQRLGVLDAELYRCDDASSPSPA